MNNLESYMSKIKQIPLLTASEEFNLGLKARKGCKEAIDQLIISNLRLVVKIANTFRNLGAPLEDLVSEGNVGLSIAASKFDPERGAKFSSYSSIWIKKYITVFISEKTREVRVPVNTIQKVLKSKRLKRS